MTAEALSELTRRTQLLRAAAEAIRASLAGSLTKLEAGLPEALRDALLADNPDRSREAAARCHAFRSDLTAAVRQALVEAPETAAPVECGVGPAGLVPPVRVEVRGTAGRRLPAEAFLVGSAPACDVQVTGDASVLPVGCIVVPLPGGVAVVDLWSSEGTRAVWDQSADPTLSQMTEQVAHAGLVLPQGKQVVLHVGARTAVTVGPSDDSFDDFLLLRIKAFAQQRMGEVLITSAVKAVGTADAEAMSALFAKSTSFESLSSGEVDSRASSRSRSPRFRPRL